MFSHGSVYDRSGHAGFRVLVMRRWPRGVRKDSVDLWIKDAGPSRSLLDGYHNGSVSWDEFERRYRGEMREERPHVLEQLRVLKGEHDTVTLLCFERMPPAEHCHRLVLLDLLDQT